MARICRNCGAELLPGASFCRVCGTAAGSEETAPKIKYCRKCGNKMSANALFCNQCGTRVSDADKQEPTEKKAAASRRKTAKPALKEEETAPVQVEKTASAGKKTKPAGKNEEKAPSTRKRTAKPALPQEEQIPQTITEAEISAASAGKARKTTASAAIPRRTSSAKARTAKPTASRQSVKRQKEQGSGFSVKFIAVLLVASLLFTGFVKPGFFLKKPRDPGYDYSGTTTVTHNNGGSNSGTNENGTSGSEGTEQVENIDLLTEELPLHYTESQIASAPAVSSAISWESPYADLGNVQVEMDYWNLEEENDTITVRELPELTQGTDGWTIRGYEVSLASGQKSFGTEVTVTVPRDENDILGECVWYNEEEGHWEDIYSELSEDGSRYIIYTNHFSLFGTKTYRFDPDTLEFVNGSGTTFNVTDGIFVEVPPDNETNRMLWKVKIDWNRMFNLYHNRVNAITDVTEIIKKNYERSLYQTQGEQGIIAYEANNVAEYYGISEYIDYFGSLSEGMYEGIVSPGGGTVGGVLGGLGIPLAGPAASVLGIGDLTLGLLKINEDIVKGNTTVWQRLKAIPDALKNNSGTVADISVLLVLAKLGVAHPVVAAIVGLAYFTVKGLYNDLYAGKVETKIPNPTLEEMYNIFYSTIKSVKYTEMGRHTNSPNSYKHIIIERPQNMEDEQFEQFKYFIDKANWGTDDRSSVYTVLNTEKKRLYFNWDKVFEALFYIYEDEDPEDLATVLDEFYYNYANAFWHISETQLKDFVKAAGFETYPDIYNTPGYERTRLTQVYADELKAETLPMIIKTLSKMQHDNCLATKQEMEKVLIPMLNCNLNFRVTDLSLDSSQKFQDSIYCYDWYDNPDNERFMYELEGMRYDNDSLKTSMRFDNVTGARFLPLLPQDTGDINAKCSNKAENYFPYTDEFLPRANKKNNKVYSCTYYHYLMMGAPSSMTFQDPKHYWGSSYTKQIQAPVEIPALASVVTKQVTNKLTGKKTEIETYRPAKSVDVEIRIPNQEEALYKGRQTIIQSYWMNGDLAYYYSGFVGNYFTEELTKALAEEPVKVGKDGRFTIKIDKTVTRDFQKNDSFALSSSNKVLHATLTMSLEIFGYLNPKTGTGNADIAGSLSLSAEGFYEWMTLDGPADFVGTLRSFEQNGGSFDSLSYFRYQDDYTEEMEDASIVLDFSSFEGGKLTTNTKNNDAARFVFLLLQQ